MIYNINQWKNKIILLISTDTGKAHEKIQNPLKIKTLNKVGIEGLSFGI